mgnify:FL=1
MELQLDFFEVNEMKTSKKKQSDPVKVNLLADKLGVSETALDRKIRRLQRKSSSVRWNRILRKTYGLRIEDHSKIDEN